MFKEYLLFCAGFGLLYPFVLTFVGMFLSVVALIPFWTLGNPFGVALTYLLGFYFIYLFLRIFLWKSPRLLWIEAGFKYRYYYFLPISCFFNDGIFKYSCNTKTMYLFLYQAHQKSSYSLNPLL